MVTSVAIQGHGVYSVGTGALVVDTKSESSKQTALATLVSNVMLIWVLEQSEWG